MNQINQVSTPATDRPVTPPTSGRRLIMLFAVAYLSHGVATQFGLIAQPLQYFMMKELQLDAAQISAYLAIMMVPWVLKPFYGLVCDFFPLFGYRRKSYAIAFNAMTACAFIVMSQTASLGVILAAFVCTAVGMAASTAVFVGIAVKEGRDEDNAGDFFSVQTFCYYVALLVAGIGGGLLCQHLAPITALHSAACIALVPPLIVTLLTLLMLKEERNVVSASHLRETTVSLKAALRSKALWMVALFIFAWDLSPSFGVALYFHESKTLGFEQAFIGRLAACNAAGMAIGAVLYGRWLQRWSPGRQLWCIVLAGTLSTGGYLLLATPASAIVLELCRGCSDMFYILAMYAFAAKFCPKGTEVTVMATLLAVKNLATDGATFIGGQLFTHVFANDLAPLMVVATATTAMCAAIVPFLIRAHKHQPQTKG